MPVTMVHTMKGEEQSRKSSKILVTMASFSRVCAAATTIRSLTVLGHCEATREVYTKVECELHC